jgi:hypothetical protein
MLLLCLLNICPFLVDSRRVLASIADSIGQPDGSQQDLPTDTSLGLDDIAKLDAVHW